MPASSAYAGCPADAATLSGRATAALGRRIVYGIRAQFTAQPRKRVNDDYPHLIGDRVMQVVADVLREHIREGDQAARWGGEEFTLTFHNSTASDVARICERIRGSIADTDFGDIAPGLMITASFGISDTTMTDNYEGLLRQADQALYRAKAAGRNCVTMHDLDRKPEEA